MLVVQYLVRTIGPMINVAYTSACGARASNPQMSFFLSRYATMNVGIHVSQRAFESSIGNRSANAR